MLAKVKNQKIMRNDEAVEPVQSRPIERKLSKLVGKKRKCMVNLSENFRELIGTRLGNG